MSWKNHEAWQACFATLSWLRWQWSPVARTKTVIERQQTKLGHGSWKLMMKSTAKWQNLGQRSNKFAWLPWKHEETTHFHIVSSYFITDWRLMVHDESRSIRCPFSTHLPFWLVLGYLGKEHPKGKTLCKRQKTMSRQIGWKARRTTPAKLTGWSFGPIFPKPT